MIQESALIPSLNQINRYNARDIADNCFLYAVCLHILRQEFEFAPWAKSYAHDTGKWTNWDQIRIHETDLYQFLNILDKQDARWTHSLKDKPASDLLMHEIHVNHVDWLQFLRNVASMKYDAELGARLLIKLERDLKITVSNYKSMRRIASDWDQAHVDTEAKSLVVTRMLQALRYKAFRGDIRSPWEQLAKIRNLELKDVCDPETQKGCGVTAATKPPSLLKQLAVGAGLGVGAYLLGKAMFGGSKT